MAPRNVIPMSDGAEHITVRDLSPTALPDAFLHSEAASLASALSLPTYAGLPDMPLYREQVIAYIDKVLSPLRGMNEGAWLSPAMVNNYVKAGLVKAPVKKLYGREHIARLLVICIFKQFLPMSAIEKLFRIQMMTYRVEVAYDYVANEVNNAVHAMFTPGDMRTADTAKLVTRESLLVRSAAAAFASKAFLMAYLRFAGYEG